MTAPNGDAYLTFDNGLQGGKGTVFYVSKSTDGGATWSSPILFATLVNPVCVFPTYCFNISGGQFRAGGTYPVPAYDARTEPARGRLRRHRRPVRADVRDLCGSERSQQLDSSEGDRARVGRSVHG